MTRLRALGVERWSLLVVLLAYLALSLSYSLVSPPFEATDEWEHYLFIRHLVETRQLPVQSVDEPRSQAHHAPLYYALGALLTSRIDDTGAAPMLNDYWAYRAERVGVDNKRLYLHTGAEVDPCGGRCLAARLLRYFSILLGAVTVVLVWQTMRTLTPDSPAIALGATALVTLNPMFIYISGAINNDNLVIVWSAAALLLAVRAVRHGIKLREALLVGVVIGLAVLSKASGLLLLPLLALAYLLAGWLRREWRQVVVGVLIVVVVVALLAGWWFARNLRLYGELTGVRLSVEIWGERGPEANILSAARELPYLWTTFWGRFGYGQIPFDPVFYRGMALVALLAMAGAVRAMVRPPQWIDREARLALLLFTAALGAFLAGTLSYMRISPMGGNGRFLFPALGAIGGLLGVGLAQYVPERWHWALSGGVTAVMAALALAGLLGYLLPAYTPPELLARDQVVARATSADVRFGEGIRLVGYQLERDRVSGGDQVAVTLCWEALAQLSDEYAYFVHFLGPQESIIGGRDTYPGLGLYPTSEWSVGDIFCDTVIVDVHEDAPAPAVYAVETGWYLPGTEERLTAYDANGAPQDPAIVSRIKVVPDEYPLVDVPVPVNADLGGQVALLGYDITATQVLPGEMISVTLYWETRALLPFDYTVFVHLTNLPDPPYAQDDSQPVDGSYPTSFWDVGEVVVDRRALLVPPDLVEGEYSLLAGMYLLETGERLPAAGADGERFAADGVRLTTVSVGPQE